MLPLYICKSNLKVNQTPQVYAHRLGTDQADDILVYEETDETVFVDITSTKDSASTDSFFYL